MVSLHSISKKAIALAKTTVIESPPTGATLKQNRPTAAHSKCPPRAARHRAIAESDAPNTIAAVPASGANSSVCPAERQITEASKSARISQSVATMRDPIIAGFERSAVAASPVPATLSLKPAPSRLQSSGQAELRHKQVAGRSRVGRPAGH